MAKKNLLCLVVCMVAAAGASLLGGAGTVAQTPDPEAIKAAAAAALSAAAKAPKKFKPFADVTKDAKKFEGLFNLYQKDEHLYAAIGSSQMDKPFLAPIVIARGLASAGMPLNFGDEWVIIFRRVGDTVQVVRKNIHYEAPKASPLEKAVSQNYTDSVLLALPIIADDAPGGALLVDFNDIFFTNFANLPIGSVDRSRTKWHKVKAFENNVELEVEATFAGGYGGYSYYGDDGVVDPRGITVVIHYSITKTPEPGYQPRYADQRVGYFISATKDFGSKDPDTIFKRRINRWRLEKADSTADLSPPKKQIVWWVEDNVPHEYRPYVEEGILEWNKAFEKIGFRNALGVRWQQKGDDFDPEDINYCTFRWVTTPATFAMSGLRADPMTGEMIDGDVVFDASWIRAWEMEYAMLVGMPLPAGGRTAAGPDDHPVVLDAGEIVSPIMAAKHGFGAPLPGPARELQRRMHHRQHHALDSVHAPRVVPANWSPLQVMLNRRLAGGHLATCQCATAMRHEFRLAAMALAARALDEADDETEEDSDAEKDDAKKTKKKSDDEAQADEPAEEKADDKEKKKTSKEDSKKKSSDESDEKTKAKDEKKIELPPELIGQLIKEIVMHEVGHSLGLRHNFKASSMLSLKEVNDKGVTESRGQTGSVMDYNPMNISPDPKKQGDFATKTIGPYDYWAIEYGYKPISGDESKELKKIADRSTDEGLAYATDEDLMISNDPHVQVYDLGDDPLAYAKLRLELAEKLMPDVDEVVRKGESWARLRSAFSVLLAQYGDAAYLASSYIGGQSFAKHHKGEDDDHDPIVPVSGKKQREALDFLAEKVLNDDAFDFPPQLLRRLTVESWYHWGSDFYYSGSVEYPIIDRILSIQRIALNHCLDAAVLSRLQNQGLFAEDDARPLEMAEVFRRLSDSVWSEISFDEDDAPARLEVSAIRRNLQREHLKRLSTIVVGQQADPYAMYYSYVAFYGNSYQYPADARSLARLHLKEIGEKIDAALEAEDIKIADTARAHLEETSDQIDKVLSAQLEASGP